ncbi:cupredoxin domain-containing protein [Aquihabitans sp. G128]|uniref:cupredoxin domain-containing protein n=1 Tax=Aquihabitans sp. G128 TaxID=2849779 RepID=UPI001C227618|nr:cupredoxin domain-containing protein [Aquihabitans sp. G128]QXC63380.1 cupredoxin domain-containing protein [Aquihabitans sp. G128]
MTSRSPRRGVPALLLALALAAGPWALVACGDGGSDAGAPADCTTVAPGDDGTTEVTVVGKNLAFDVTCLEVQPGTLVVTFENRDGGVSHDFHVTGHGVNASTDLVQGVTTQQLTVELTEPGSYTFACDPHATMEGRLVVAEAPRG